MVAPSIPVGWLSVAGQMAQQSPEYSASEENKRKNRRPDNKYRYEVDFSTALSIARDYFLRPPEDDINIIKILTRFVHAVKEPFRKFKRPLRGIGAIHFNYR